jgi:hypothetical protein
MKVSSPIKESLLLGGAEAGVQVAEFDEETGARVSDWRSHSIPAESWPVFARPDGYPSNLGHFQQSSRLNRLSAVTHIGKGGAFVAAGTYVCEFQGGPDAPQPGENATHPSPLVFENDATEISFDPVAKQYRVQVTPDRGVVIRIMSTNPADPIHGITFVPEAFVDSYVEQPFHPELLDQLTGVPLIR